jgi:hypothetical protein
MLLVLCFASASIFALGSGTVSGFLKQNSGTGEGPT